MDSKDLHRFSSRISPNHSNVYLYAGPVNLVFCVLIFFENSLIVSFFYKRRERLSAFLFILIAMTDIFLACNETIDISIGIICSSDWKNSISGYHYFLILNLVYPTHFAYSCSVFYNTVLTVIRSINIASPFFRIITSAVRLSLLIVTLIVLSITVADCFLTPKIIKLSQNATGCDYFWRSIDIPDFASAFITLVFYPDFAIAGNWKVSWPIIIPYVLANIIIFVCMVIQIISIIIRRSSASEQNDSMFRDSNYAALTIVLISLLFFLCNTAELMYLFVPEDKVNFVPLRPTLPLINAAGYPLILILRGSELRQWIIDKLFSCFSRRERDNVTQVSK